MNYLKYMRQKEKRVRISQSKRLALQNYTTMASAPRSRSEAERGTYNSDEGEGYSQNNDDAKRLLDLL